jgi:hypothetical protein
MPNGVRNWKSSSFTVLVGFGIPFAKQTFAVVGICGSQILANSAYKLTRYSLGNMDSKSTSHTTADFNHNSNTAQTFSSSRKVTKASFLNTTSLQASDV